MTAPLRGTGATVVSDAFDSLEDSAIGGAAVFGLVGAITLVLSFVGLRSDGTTIAALFAAVAVFAAIIVHVIRSNGASHSGWAASYLLAACSLGVLMAMEPSQNTNIDRDPAVYNTTARTMADAPSLFVHADVGPFEDHPDLSFSTAGLYDVRGDGELEFQFNHLAPSLGSAMYVVGGYRALFRLPALMTAIGVLAVGLVARRLTRSPALGLLTILTLGICLPIVSIGRDSYSEPTAFAFLWLAILAIGRATNGHPRHAWLAAVLLGWSVMARIDSLAYVAVIALALAADVLVSEHLHARTLRRLGSRLLLGVVPATAISLIDLRYVTGNYATDLSAQTRQLYAVVAASIIAFVVVSTITTISSKPSEVIQRVRPMFAKLLPPAVIMLLVFGWLVRPHLGFERTPNGNSYLENIQQNEGVTVDGRRTYAEQTLVWMSWYLGSPALAAAILGSGLATRRWLRQRQPDTLLATVVVLFLVMGAIYFRQPSITPDHIWAMRRYAPALLPCLVLGSVGALAALADAIPERGRMTAIAVVGLIFLGSAARTTIPVIRHRTQFGSVGVLEQLCEMIGPEAVVIFPEYEGNAAAIRAWCGVPVAIARDTLAPDALHTLAVEWHEQGRQLYLVARDESVINRYFPGLPSEQKATTLFVNQRWLERTTESAPNAYVSQNLRIVAQAVPTNEP